MYFISHPNVNCIIVGFGRRWLVFIATTDGLRQSASTFHSLEAARAAVGAH